jgi:hypothetical protein
MFDITNYLSLSALKNETFRFQSTTYDDEKVPTYTTTAIRTWMYGDIPHQCPENNGHMLHEVAHVIDMFRRDKNRLLKENFGYVRKREPWPLKHLQTEATVIGLQMCLADMDQAFFRVSPVHSFYSSIDDDGDYVGLPMTLAEFSKLVEETYLKENVLGLLEEWQQACEFVKVNR